MTLINIISLTSCMRRFSLSSMVLVMVSSCIICLYMNPSTTTVSSSPILGVFRGGRSSVLGRVAVLPSTCLLVDPWGPGNELGRMFFCSFGGRLCSRNRFVAVNQQVIPDAGKLRKFMIDKKKRNIEDKYCLPGCRLILCQQLVQLLQGFRFETFHCPLIPPLYAAIRVSPYNRRFLITNTWHPISSSRSIQTVP